MAEFKQAIQWMKEGKKVRRRGVHQIDEYVWHIPNVEKGNFKLTTVEKPETDLILEDFEAEDWEIVEEDQEERILKKGQRVKIGAIPISLNEDCKASTHKNNWKLFENELLK